MRILVTGGAGFIGSHVSEAALEAGHEVMVVDDLSTGKIENLPPSAEFHPIDIRNRDAFREAALRFDPHAISHHAAQASVSSSVRDPVVDAEINVLGSLHVASVALECESRFVFSSTGGALYGEVPDGQVAAEGWAARPLSPYACSKASFELYLRAYGQASGLRYTILRYGNVYGPRQDPHGEAGVVAIFLRRLLSAQPIQVNARATEGDDGCVRDYVFVRDAVRANLAAFEGVLDGRTINIATGVGTSTRTLAERLVGLVDEPAVVNDGAFRAGDLQRSVLDPSVMISALGEPTPLEQGLSDTTEWFREEVQSS
ncbi:MAG: NAD-dependent epimerase/dehydratase family protein [Myxococcales bacterium]|nr:NAD-dependent epimerase/dehydratase family protein [Deltaproteobacteria bacterium]MBT8481902.1 NAD-dependent epimerase/dehydratase family protein [Deltaproteobacteria bacterium]NNL24765.1 NAD-dependent epimerase/dehydratase family protein [Myxococcales bacterium]RZV54874.1 MAG: NAD-dependent epimerase/dehydratase family protein [Deltaproteobacteria bacterium]